MLVFAFRSEICIVQNFNFTVFEDFSLSLSWKYRFLQNVNHGKVQSKTNKYCKFHVDLTRRRLSKSRFKKLGMVSKKLSRNTLSLYARVGISICLFVISDKMRRNSIYHGTCWKLTINCWNNALRVKGKNSVDYFDD